MDFSFSADQQLLKNSARAFLDDRCTPALVHSLIEDPRGMSDAMWKDVAQLGWLGLALPEAHGGSGLGMVETAILLEEMGRAAFPGPYLPTVLAATAIIETGTETQRKRWLPPIASGEARASVAFLDDSLDWDVARATETRAERGRTGVRLRGTKRFVPWAQVADVILVPAREAEGLALYLVTPSDGDLGVGPVSLMDVASRWATLHLDVTVPADAVLARPGQAATLLERLLRRGAIGAAAEMLGAARRCLDMTVGYAKVREQFGQPIGSFQAIRHTCAEMLMEVENSHAAVYYAAWAVDAAAEDQDLAPSVAKAYVSDAARRVCGDAIQVHGGIGFTWEYDLHLYVKRAKALETMYGDAEFHRELVTRRISR